MTVAILGGTAGLGRALAIRLASSGVRVVIGSRSEEKAREVAKEVSRLTGSAHVEGRRNEDAIEGAEFVVFAVPYPGMYEVAKAVRTKLGEGSVIVSAIVPLESDLGGPARYIEPSAGSAAEALQEQLRGFPVVSAFHYTPASLLEDLSAELDVVVCGEREPAYRLIELLRGVRGIRPLYGGPLRNSRVTERLVQLLIEINREHKTKAATLRFAF
ncbi:MAG: NADPH-dependent F420 reductase [Aigarchaeota archaeon]|nr:NADPH-dependent F420 reductase [Candidatus Calditenuis fumarioli]